MWERREVQALLPLARAGPRAGCERARLELAREPVGVIRRGAFVVARSVPLGPQRWALLGRPVVVEPSVAADFETLLAALEAPLGEFWRVHGGVLAHAAWAWPEECERTIEGEIVQTSLSAYGVTEIDLLVGALDADDELAYVGRLDDGCDRWHWMWNPPAPLTPAPELGVRFELCSEDRGPRPYLVELDVDASTSELWMSALTPTRFALAERLLRARFGTLLGPLLSLHVDHRSELPRWKQLRLERAIVRLEPGRRAA